MKAVDTVKKENIDFLLAVGGGSVLDATKFIAAASKFNGDPLTILTKGALVNEAIPLGSVITLPATGSEMNTNSVISIVATNEKLHFSSEKVYPQFSIIDPETTYSLSPTQTINGIVDTYVHVMEQYATYDVNTPLQDSWALGLLKTLLEQAPNVLKNPKDYDSRANIFWCATCGLNFWLSLGCVQDWATHMIGHELTAFYGLDHGQTLAIILPKVLQNQKAEKTKKLAKLAREVFNSNETDDSVAADIAIAKTEEFFTSIGQKIKLADYGINAEEAAVKIRDRFLSRKTIVGENGVIDGNVAYEIVKSC
jgi:NADP-dependent alcohol dehydrogenase